MDSMARPDLPDQQTEMTLAGAVSKLGVAVNRLDVLIFGERPQVPEKSTLSSDVIMEMKNQVMKAVSQLNECNNRLKLLK